MSEESLTVKSRLGDYPVYFHHGLQFLKELVKPPESVVVADRKVAELYAEEWREAFGGCRVLLLDANEEDKTLATVGKIYDWVIGGASAKRNLNFVSIGGGIIQDISGFAASTLFRGLNWTYVPTTLLAQVDSCIGGKTSLNYGSHKNLLGTFFPPKSIHIAAQFTSTLSELDRCSGYGEIIKFLLMKKFEQNGEEDVASRMKGISADPARLTPLIRECLDIKRSFMEDDEFDRGRRNLLNYGHCFGHALESASGYYVPHGIAVNIGMIFANLAAVERGTISPEEFQEITATVNLPFLFLRQRPQDYDAGTLLHHLKNDKKRTGNLLPLVIPAHGGLLRLNDFTDDEFHAALGRLKGILFQGKEGVE